MSEPDVYHVETERLDQKVTTVTYPPQTVRRLVEQAAARAAGDVSGLHVSVTSARNPDGSWVVHVVEDYTQLTDSHPDRR